MSSKTDEKQKYSVMLVVAIVCVGLMYNANSGFTVVLNSIIGDFFKRGIRLTGSQIGMILSLPSLLMIPGVLLSGKLAQYISVRTIAVISWIIFGVTSIALYFSLVSISAFLAVRALMGFGVGLCQPISRAIPGKLFEGNLRAKVIGYISMGGGVLSVAMSLLFGQLALTNWRNCLFLFPIISVAFIILAIAFIPKIPPEKKEAAAQTSEAKQPFGRPVYVLCLAGFCVYTVGAVIQIKTSIIVAQAGIGGANYAGYLSALNTCGIIVGGLLFGNVYRKLKRNLFPLAAIVTALFFYLFASAHSFILMALSGFFICCVSIGMLMPYLIARVTFVSPRPRITMAITLVTVSNYIGQFLTTYYIIIIEKLFHAPMIDTGTGAQPLASVSLYSVAVVYAIISIVGAIYIRATRNEEKSAI